MSLRRVLSLLMVCWLLTLSGCTKWAEKSNPTWRQATSGEHLSNLFWKEVQAKNWTEVEAHIAPEFVSLGSGRVLDRAGLMQHLKSMDVQGFQIGEVETRSAGKDLIVTYLITVHGTVGGNQFPTSPIRMMAVWQELNHGWVMVAHAVSQQ